MLARSFASAAELFKGGTFIINKVSLLACGVEYVHMIHNWAVSHSFVNVHVLCYFAGVQT